jgi:hypothetical protein
MGRGNEKRTAKKKASIRHVFCFYFIIFALVFVVQVDLLGHCHSFSSTALLLPTRKTRDELFGHVYWQGMFGRKQWFSVKTFLVAGGGLAAGLHPIIWYQPGCIRFHPVVQIQMEQLRIDVQPFN